MESEGISLLSVSRCDILEKLMKDKLYTHHAIQDSIEVSDSEIYDYVDQSIDFFSEQLGSLEKALEFYNKPDEATFRDELFKLNKEQKLSSLMQSDIVEKVEITPEEVKQFFESIPKEQIPVFGTELEISQIVIEPIISDEEKDNVINQLKSFKIDVEEKGLSFGSKAILYSQDPGSRSNGGKYTLHRKKPRMYKEFRDVAFSLRENEISDPFETESGWHIIKVDKNNLVTILHSSVRCMPVIPGVLVLNESKTYGKIKDRHLYRCIPDDRRLPVFLMAYKPRVGFSKNMTNKYVVFKFKAWEGKHPIATNVQTIGDVSELVNFYEYQLYCKSLYASIQDLTKKTMQLSLIHI